MAAPVRRPLCVLIALARAASRKKEGSIPPGTLYFVEIVSIDVTGDALLVEFGSVVDAVRCAVEIQRAKAERNSGLGTGRRLDFRIGINIGDIIVEGDDIPGDGLNIAARLVGELIGDRLGALLAREGEAKDGAAARIVGDSDAAPMGIHDGAHDRES